MSKYPAPLPHDIEAEDKEFHAAFADAMRKAAPVSPPAPKPALELGGSGAGLVGNPPYVCAFCGRPSWVDPSDQTPPAGYCHESDHGEPDSTVPVVALLENPCTVQTFESWVETLGDLYRTECALDCVEWSPFVAQMLNARLLLDEYRAFAAVCRG